MDKIMVPVDFSSASSWGFYYAYNLAKLMNSELIVLHLYWPPYADSSYPMDVNQTIINKKEEEVLLHLKAATRTPLADPDRGKVTINYVLRSGSENSISSTAKDLGVDLIIMGTHGAGKAMDKIWGSNTTNVIKYADCPVLAIPEGAKFEGVKNIAYATNFDEKDTELLFQLRGIAIAIQANLHCIHVNKADAPYEEITEEEFKTTFEANFEDLPITYSVWSASSVEEGLETFCRINNIDILAMLTHNKTLWEKVFGSKSMTRTMAMRSNLPLLAFHK